ncbi:MAG: cytidylate kinase family protein [Candidatus Pacebacteria bacterium]|nr:cytidylate kinase family protein [Candidatus Paceibacterota bacterium]
MAKKHIITIAGKLGSGKSSTAKMVSEILNYKHLSTGDFMRSIANEKGISLALLSQMAEKDDSIDKALDDRNLEIGKMENVVLDSRLGFYFIPGSFKVFLELDPHKASERILEDIKSNPNRHTEDDGVFNTKESIMESINTRLLSERKRYNNLYKIEDLTAHENFDLVIDTSNTPLPDVSKKIIEEYNKWINK